MNFLGRSSLNVTRNFGKTIALLLTVFILACGVSGAISVRQAIQSANVRLRATIPAIATIERDERALTERYVITGEHFFPEGLTIGTLTDIGALPYVRNYDVSAEMSLFSKSLDLVGLMENFGMGDWQVMNLKGTHNPVPLDAEEGVVEVISGRTFTEEEVGTLSYIALVSQYFADQNNLSIGSVFTLDNIVWKDEALELQNFTEENMFAHRSYDFEVAGIFVPVAGINTGDELIDRDIESRIKNRIYVPNAVVIAATIFQVENLMEVYPDVDWGQGNPEDHISFVSVYALHDSGDMDTFRVAAQNILPEFWMVTDTGSSFESIAISMEVLDELAIAMLWSAVGAAIIIVSLLVLLFLKERKKEIGIYLSLGEKKSKIIFQIMFEILTVSLIAVAFALFAGNILAAEISEAMLRDDMVVEQSINDVVIIGTLEQMGAIENMSTDEMLAAYDVSLDITTILIFFAASLATIIVSTVAPMFYIVRLDPKKIML